MFLLGWRVGAAQTKALLRGRSAGGSQQVRARYSHKKKRHDFVPEEMSHLHSEARGVWKHGGTKFKSDLKSVLKTKTDCTVFGTMISAR